MKSFFVKRNIIILILTVSLVGGGFFLVSLGKSNKMVIAVKSLDLFNKFSKLLIVEEDRRKEVEVLDKLVNELTKKDDITKSFLILLQNNMELRPGGGFLGQYAIVKIKNGEIISTFIEDANLLDQRIDSDIPAPYPFKKMMQVKKWKFRDSNFSPDFPINAEKAKYFLRLAGGQSNFDGVIAINATVLNEILKITGPITVPGYPGVYDSGNAVLKLEEQVEKAYIMDPALDTQNRKAIMREMGPIIIDKLLKVGNISKLAEFGHVQMQKKDVMLNFKDPNLQALAASVHWDGAVPTDWSSDFLMAVDANMGALKTNYYIKREIDYSIDLTQTKPVVTLNLLYKNTAPYGDWRTSDYHSYLRLYVPEGANILEREMVSYPNIGTEFGKTFFGFTLHVLIGGETKIKVKYELPENFDRENYRLLMLKQSGVEDIPVKVHINMGGGEMSQEGILTKDLKFQLEK